MIEARHRVAAWTDGRLNLSGLELTELPPLPATVTYLSCYDNQLTSLPDLPAALTELYCFNNKLTSLPVLPNTLKTLCCGQNKLTSLPALPPTLTNLICSNNELTSLPNLPATLRELYCSYNHLSSLSIFPATLELLMCHKNDLPVYRNVRESIYEYEKRLRCAEKLVEQQSRHRSVLRCRAVMEELMMVCWSPDRLDRLIASYPTQQWNYVLHAYGPLTVVTLDEIL